MDEQRIESASRVAASGMSFGGALAICISWDAYHSVPWAIMHGACSWGFVLWWCVFGN